MRCSVKVSLDAGADVLEGRNRLLAFLLPLFELLLIVGLDIGFRDLDSGTKAIVDESQKCRLPPQPLLQSVFGDAVGFERLSDTRRRFCNAPLDSPATLPYPPAQASDSG